MDLRDLRTPALVVDADLLAHNIAEMSRVLPGPRLRPHVKAHKSTAIARLQARAGHPGFTCATVREAAGLIDAGLGEDILLAKKSSIPVPSQASRRPHANVVPA